MFHIHVQTRLNSVCYTWFNFVQQDMSTHERQRRSILQLPSIYYAVALKNIALLIEARVLKTCIEWARVVLLHMFSSDSEKPCYARKTSETYFVATDF